MDQHSDRILTEKQIKELEDDIYPSVTEWQPVAVFSVVGAEPMQYAGQFLDVFSKCNFNIMNGKIPASDQYFPIDSRENSTSNKGLIVSVIDKNHSDKDSVKLFNILKEYGLSPGYSQRIGDRFNVLGIYIAEK